MGDVAIKNVADLYLYPNTVRAVKVTGAELKDWLERSAGMFNQVEPGSSGADAPQPRFPVLQFRRDRRGDLPDRPLPAFEIHREGRRPEPGCQPDREPDL